MKYQNYVLGFLCLTMFVGCEIGEDDDFNAVHYQGKECMACHSFGEHSFSSGVTIYKNIDGKNYDEAAVARDHTVQLLLEDGTKLKYVAGNGYGNVKYKGDEGAINNFTAQVLDANGKVVNQSLSNSHNVGRLACNTCHTQSGLNGADGRVVNFDYTGSLSQALEIKSF